MTPIASRTASGSCVMSWPATRTSPPSAPISLDRKCVAVVLLASLGPGSAATVPSVTARSMPPGTSLPLYGLRSAGAAIRGR
jgi:hypothetical protein